MFWGDRTGSRARLDFTFTCLFSFEAFTLKLLELDLYRF